MIIIMTCMFYHLQAVCIAVTALLHFFLLTTFFMMFGVGTFFFMNVTVLFYAMRITNNFNSRSRLKWIVGSAIGKLVSESIQYNLTNISLFIDGLFTDFLNLLKTKDLFS